MGKGSIESDLERVPSGGGDLNDTCFAAYDKHIEGVG